MAKKPSPKSWVLHRTYVGGVKRGEHNLTLQSLERIVDARGINPLKLLQR